MLVRDLKSTKRGKELFSLLSLLSLEGEIGVGDWRHTTVLFEGTRLICFSGLGLFGNLSPEEQSRGLMSVHVVFGLGWCKSQIGVGHRGPVRMVGSYHDLVVANVGSCINCVHLLRDCESRLTSVWDICGVRCFEDLV